MDYIEKAKTLITQQQGKVEQFSPVYGVGEQLKDLIRNDPAAAEIVATDLEQEGMGLADCEEKIREWADEQHRKSKGRCVFVPPSEAERIIRKFYGIENGAPAAPEVKAEQASAPDDDVSLFDFL